MASRITPYHIGVWLLSVYLGTAPIYWLPGVSLQAVAAAKALLASLAVLAVLVEAIFRNQLRLPTGLLGPPGLLILVLLSTPAILQAETLSKSLAFLFDLTLGIGFLWCFAILAREGADLPKLFVRSLFIIAAAALFTLYSSTAVQSVASPFDTGPLSATGFGSARTGWSNGLSFYLPVTLLLFVKNPPRRHPALLQLAVIGLILGSQALSGGRAGLLASLFVLLAFLTIPRSRPIAILYLTAFAVIAIVLADRLLQHLRIDDLLQYGSVFALLDDFSASRLAGYVLAWEHIRARPILGYGFGQVLLTIPHIGVFEIHNLWLKLATESGVLLPLFFLIVVIRVLWSTRRSIAVQPHGGGRSTLTSLVLIILVGLLVSQFEPGVLLGSFQNSAVWWAAMGWAATTARRSTPPPLNQPTSPSGGHGRSSPA